MIELMRLVDLSHVIEDGLVTYPGLRGPRISEHLTFEASRSHYADGTEFSIGRIDMLANTGTYLDTPAHRFPGGHDLSALPLDRCADLPAVVVDANGTVTANDVAGVELAGAALLLRTGWDAHWGTERYGERDHPHLTADAAQAVVEAGVALVGIDSVNIDATTTGERPAHTRLLRAGIPIVEHLTGLDQLPATGARFTAVPPLIVGMGTFPVRAFATLP
jgi:kynurenine formamidase